MRIVVGDHWAIGPMIKLEEDEEVKILGPGLPNYLAVHRPTMIVGKAWSHILEQIEMFEEMATHGYEPSSGDEIVWILPDPFLKWVVTDYEYLLDGAKTIKEGVNRQVDRFLTRIHDVAEKFNLPCPIKIVGGGCDLSTITLLSELPRLQFPVPSWMKLLDPDFVPTVFNEVRLPQISGFIVKHRPDLMEELGKITDTVKQKRKSILHLQNTRDLTGDIDPMPTSKAHKKLFVNLFPMLKL